VDTALSATFFCIMRCTDYWCLRGCGVVGLTVRLTSGLAGLDGILQAKAAGFAQDQPGKKSLSTVDGTLTWGHGRVRRAMGIAEPTQTAAISNAATGTERWTATDLRSVLMRSISCSVCAEKYDSPQLGHDHIGMFSITSSAAPLSKLRVTCLTCTALLPQCSQWCSAEVTGDDNEFAAKAGFDNRLGRLAAKGDAVNDVFDFTGLAIALAGDDLACEDDVFKVEDCEVVIIKLFGCVG